MICFFKSCMYGFCFAFEKSYSIFIVHVINEYAQDNLLLKSQWI